MPCSWLLDGGTSTEGNRPMIRQFIQITLLTGAMVAGFVPVTLAQGSDSPGSKDVVATVTAIDASTTMATLTTEAGEVFEHPKESQWHVGHKVECKRIDQVPPRLQHCQPWESARHDTGAAQGGLSPRR
jgi:hypothetical protein